MQPYLGLTADLDEVVSRNVLKLRHFGHLDWLISQKDLAALLPTRYRLGGIDEIIVLARDALVLRPPGHPDRPMFPKNLRFLLSTWYERLGGTRDLNRAIICCRDSLALRHQGPVDFFKQSCN